MIMLTPKDLHHTQGIVFEFKHVQGENMNDAALKALKQIQRFDYATLLRRYSHITHIVKVGLAFSGKAVSSVYTTEILATGGEGELIWGA